MSAKVAAAVWRAVGVEMAHPLLTSMKMTGALMTAAKLAAS
ncbi:MAG: hypothetical protein R2749_14745 [Acidimicrobiales bacterium]